MNKFEAISQLMTKQCDAIRHGTSVFVMHNDDIVNKRSKKPLDNKKMYEAEWSVVVEPKWYDELPEKPVLCWINNADVSIIHKIREDGDFENGNEEVFAKENVHPVTPQEAKGLTYGTITVKRKSADIQKDSGEDEGNEDMLQKQNTEPTAKQKVVVTSGTPAIVTENKNIFMNLGLPEEMWNDFWKENNFDSINIVAFIEDRSDEEIKNTIGKYISEKGKDSATIDTDEIPF